MAKMKLSVITTVLIGLLKTQSKIKACNIKVITRTVAEFNHRPCKLSRSVRWISHGSACKIHMLYEDSHSDTHQFFQGRGRGKVVKATL